jgi:hypothetical protein
MKLFIQNLNDKFIKNVSLVENNSLVVVTDNIDNNLYQIHYNYDFDAYIFVASLMNKEIYQYILEFNRDKKIILYNDILDWDVFDSLRSFCTHIGEYDIEGMIKLPPLINDHIFFDMKKPRQKHIPCLIDNKEILDNNLLSVLYPEKKFNIRLFGSLIKHPQNVGFLTEKNKAKILNESESCLVIDNQYLPEIISCGTKVLRAKKGELVPYDIENINLTIETYAHFLNRI